MTVSTDHGRTEANSGRRRAQVALIGNPNAGKTTLFNALTGLRAKTANYPGITVDVRRGRMSLADQQCDVVDLPGLYSLDSLTPEEKLAAAMLCGELPGEPRPDVVVLVLDATNLERNLFLASEILDLQVPTIVALSLMDAAEAAGISVNVERVADELRCPVIPISSRSGAGLDELRAEISQLLGDRRLPVAQEGHVSCTAGCTGCQFGARYDWASSLASRAIETPESHGRRTAAIDSILTRTDVGLGAFFAMMLGVFYLIFSLAGVPMGLIESVFAWLAAGVDRVAELVLRPGLTSHLVNFVTAALIYSAACRVAGLSWNRLRIAIGLVVCAGVAALPTADFRSLLVDGVVGGVGGVVVFLPQICILFFFISLLEDSGYMARAAFVMEKVMRFVGLPGQAFVPMLSAHACAIPGIMATRVIENWRDRLATILVLPLMTCSARLPVYAMVAALLFADSPAAGAVVFLGAYLLGIGAALGTAFCLKSTVLRGEPVPLVLELPPYRLPSLRNALTTVVDRALVFMRKAGTVILLISVVLWALATYPKLPAESLPVAAQTQIDDLQARAELAAEPAAAEELLAQVEHLVAQEELAYSWAGRAGRAVEPIFRPLGFDWKINVGVISSFAAREVIVSTLAIIYGVGEESGEDAATLTETLKGQLREDGSPVYTTATSLSLLVFYVLAMQCLPTQAVTKRETGSWNWAIFQLVYMTALAYLAALITYQVVSRVT